MTLKTRGKALAGSSGDTGNQPQETPNDVLESWKEIGAFIGRDERTAMRWAKEQGMPVRRAPGRRGRIYGSRSEILEWQKGLANQGEFSGEPGRPTPSGFPISEISPSAKPDSVSPWSTREGLSIKHLLVGVAISVLVTILAISLLARNQFRPGAPSTVRFVGSTIEAVDADGHILWKHVFARPLDPRGFIGTNYRPGEFFRVADLLGDGEQEVLVVVPLRSGPNPTDVSTSELDCFSSRGTLLWSYAPHEAFTFGDHEVTDPWSILDVMVAHEGRLKSIWVSLTGSVWGNSFVAQLDPRTGLGTKRFVNTGTLFALQELRTADRTFLVAGGFDNEYEKGSLALIDESKPFAASPQTSGTRHKCANCLAGDPDYYFVFPRSEINAHAKEWLNAVRRLTVHEKEIQVSKSELADHRRVEAFYLLSFAPSVRVASLRYSSDYDLAHRELDHNGEIEHALADCPERFHPEPIRVWTPADGWRELSVKPSAP